MSPERPLLEVLAGLRQDFCLRMRIQRGMGAYA